MGQAPRVRRQLQLEALEDRAFRRGDLPSGCTFRGLGGRRDDQQGPAAGGPADRLGLGGLPRLFEGLTGLVTDHLWAGPDLISSNRAAWDCKRRRSGPSLCGSFFNHSSARW